LSKASSKKPRGGVDYFALSRTPAASYLFIVPLFALYQAGIVFFPSARNGTETIYREMFHRFHWVGAIVVNLVVLGLLFLAIHHTRERRKELPGMYAWMFFESTVWASALYIIAFLFPMAALDIRAMLSDLTAAIGAGIYEEGLFRFVLMGGLIVVLHGWMGAPRSWVVPLAAVLSAVVFSYAHHEGSGLGSEPWNGGRFLLRTLLGTLLGAIYWVRGLGIVVYTHALYNVAVILPSHV
jgi:hypothetical protein